MAVNEEKYFFKYIDKKYETISGKENKDYLIKWYVIIGLRV
jgi:hypothetical protein